LERIFLFANITTIFNLRLVNGSLYEAVTTKLRKNSKYIHFNTEARLKKFLEWKEHRDALEMMKVPLLSPVLPLTAFQINILEISLETLEIFAKTCGPHIEKYSFHSDVISYEEQVDLGCKVSIFLSHSPQLNQIELPKNYDLHVLTNPILRFGPMPFPQISPIVFPSNHGYSSPLVDLLFRRIPELERLNALERKGKKKLCLKIIRLVAEVRPADDFPLDRREWCYLVYSKIKDMPIDDSESASSSRQA